VLQEEHLQLPGWQVQLVQVQEALEQAILRVCEEEYCVVCGSKWSCVLVNSEEVSFSIKRRMALIRLLTDAESPLQSSQMATLKSRSRKREIGCMGRCISKRESPFRYPYRGLGLAHSSCLDLAFARITVFDVKY